MKEHWPSRLKQENALKDWIEKNGDENMEYEVKESKVIEDGTHKGKIVAVEERTKPYNYVDVIIDFEGFKMKSGYPAIILETSKLGQLLSRFGADLKVGTKIKIEDVLVGKECLFITMRKERYANIIPDSVKPI